MEIQQHDGAVVVAAAISVGLRQASARGRGGAWGEGGARDFGAAALPPPTIYRVPRGGAGPRDWISRGGGGQGGRPTWLGGQATPLGRRPLEIQSLGLAPP